jgi:serine/threonine protein kinase
MSSALGDGLDEARGLFEKEKLVLSLSHPNIVTGVDAYEQQNSQWGETEFIMVMEWLDGTDLRETLDRQERLPPLVALSVFKQCAAALAYAAAHGVTHRDIKPGNIFLLREGTAKILDFGVGRFESSTGNKTTTGLPGTVEYLAPDLGRGECRGDECSDIFSFGICLFEALTGRRPFGSMGESDQERMMQYVSWARTYTESTVDFSDEVFVGMPGLKRLLLGCLASSRQERWQGFAAVEEQIAAILEDPEGSACPSDGGGTDTGTTALGGYRLLRRLSSQGGFARIWLASAPGVAADRVVLKILREQFQDAERIEDFRREARVLQLLSGCPYVVQFIDSFTAQDNYGDEQHCIALEYVPGGDLRALLDESGGGLPPDRVFRIFRCVAIALSYAHSLPEPVTHRDLKPENIICPADGGAKLIDFGIAHEAGGSRLTEGGVKGTWDYIAPEFAVEKSFHGDACSDIYSLGICLHEAVTGELPYPKLAGSDLSVILAFFDRLDTLDVEAVDWSHPTYVAHPELRDLVARCIESDRTKRLADPAVVADVLNSLAEPESSGPAPAEPVSQEAEEDDAPTLLAPALPASSGEGVALADEAMVARASALVDLRLDLAGKVLLPTQVVTDEDGSPRALLPDTEGLGRPVGEVVNVEFGAAQPQTVVSLLADVLQTLAVMHSRSLWHGDLRSESIFVRDQACLLGHPRLTAAAGSPEEAMAGDLGDVARTWFVCACPSGLGESLDRRCREAGRYDPESYLMPTLVRRACAVTLIPELARLLTYLAQGGLGTSDALQRCRALLARPYCGRLVGANRRLEAELADYDVARVPQNKWYEFLQELDAGGCGVVWVARRLTDGTKLALKSARDEFSETRFDDEIRTLQEFSHPNIVSYVDAFREPDPKIGADRSYLVMELLVGTSLRALIRGRNHGKCDYGAGDVVRYFDGYLAALGYCHQHGIVHRDLKPANLYITEDGTPKLLDFGIARNTRATQTAGHIPGTFEYMAPEFGAPKEYGLPAGGQFRGDELSDLFALGLCFYEAITGRTAFGERLPRPKRDITPCYLAFRQRCRRLSGRTDVWFETDGMAPVLQQFLRRALCPVRTERFPSATAFRQELATLAGMADEELLLPSDVTPPPPPVLEPPEEDGTEYFGTQDSQYRTMDYKGASRRRRKIWLAALFFVVFGLGAGVFFNRGELIAWVNQSLRLKAVPTELARAESLADLRAVLRGLERMRPQKGAWEVRRERFDQGFDHAVGEACQVLRTRLVAKASSAAAIGQIASAVRVWAEESPTAVKPREKAILTDLRDRGQELISAAPTLAEVHDLWTSVSAAMADVDVDAGPLNDASLRRLVTLQQSGNSLGELEQTWDMLTGFGSTTGIDQAAKGNLAKRHELILATGAAPKDVDELEASLGHLERFVQNCQSALCGTDADVASWKQEVTTKVAPNVLESSGGLFGQQARELEASIDRGCQAATGATGEADWADWGTTVSEALEKLAGLRNDRWPKGWTERFGGVLAASTPQGGKMADEALRNLLADGSRLHRSVAALCKNLPDDFYIGEYAGYQALAKVAGVIESENGLSCPWLSPLVAGVRKTFDPEADKHLAELEDCLAKHDFASRKFRSLASYRDETWPGSTQRQRWEKVRKAFELREEAAQAWTATIKGFAAWQATPTMTVADDGGNAADQKTRDSIGELAAANPFSAALPSLRTVSAGIGRLRTLRTIREHADALQGLGDALAQAAQAVTDGTEARTLIQDWRDKQDELAKQTAASQMSLQELTGLAQGYPPLSLALELAWGGELKRLLAADVPDTAELPPLPEAVRKRYGDECGQLGDKLAASIVARLGQDTPVESRRSRLQDLEQQIAKAKRQGLFLDTQAKILGTRLTQQLSVAVVRVRAFDPKEWELQLKGADDKAVSVDGSADRTERIKPLANAISYHYKALGVGKDSTGDLAVEPGGGVLCPPPTGLPAEVAIEWDWDAKIPAAQRVPARIDVQQGNAWQQVANPFRTFEGTELALRLSLPGYEPVQWQARVAADGKPTVQIQVPAPDTPKPRTVRIEVEGDAPQEIRYGPAGTQLTACQKVKDLSVTVLPGRYEFFLTYAKGPESQHNPVVEIAPAEDELTIKLASHPPTDGPTAETIADCMRVLDQAFVYTPGGMTGLDPKVPPMAPAGIPADALSRLAGLAPGDANLAGELQRAQTPAARSQALLAAAARLPAGAESWYLLYAAIVLGWGGGPVTVADCCAPLSAAQRQQVEDLQPLRRFVQYSAFRGADLFAPDRKVYRTTAEFFAGWVAKPHPSFTVTKEDRAMLKYVQEALQ